MCNAWNHTPGCTCGWGGVFYGSGAPRGKRPSLILSSYINPGARCPVCRRPVFYFESRNGGRVFFDELGPPWPKHGCTDNGDEKAASPLSSANKTSTTYRWQLNGWSPFILELVYDYSPLLLRIDGKLDGEAVRVFVRKSRLPSIFDPREFLELSAIQC